jgi:hypothetical protein
VCDPAMWDTLQLEVGWRQKNHQPGREAGPLAQLVSVCLPQEGPSRECFSLKVRFKDSLTVVGTRRETHLVLITFCLGLMEVVQVHGTYPVPGQLQDALSCHPRKDDAI